MLFILSLQHCDNNDKAVQLLPHCIVAAGNKRNLSQAISVREVTHIGKQLNEVLCNTQGAKPSQPGFSMYPQAETHCHVTALLGIQGYLLQTVKLEQQAPHDSSINTVTRQFKLAQTMPPQQHAASCSTG